MRASYLLTVAVLFAGVSAAAPIRPPRVAEDPPLTDQTLAVSLDSDGALIIPGRESLKKIEDVRAFFAAQIVRIKKFAESNKEPFAPALALRIDASMTWARVVEILELAKQAGFENANLKATK